MIVILWPDALVWLLVAIIAGTSSFLAGQADALQAELQAAGVQVTRISIERDLDDYSDAVAQAVASGADTLYVGTRTREGALREERRIPCQPRDGVPAEGETL